MTEYKEKQVSKDLYSQSGLSAYDYNKKILELIEEIYKNHTDFCNSHRDFLNINLNKKRVHHMFPDKNNCAISEDYYKPIMQYVTELNMFIIQLDLYCTYSDLDLSQRVKNQDSIINKLHYYRYKKREQGKVPIRKCLNDLLGFRVIIPDFQHNDEDFLRQFDRIKEEKNLKIRIEDSTKNDYVATHVYFQESGRSYPWELQIWSERDNKKNKESHAKYKQGYTKWGEEYKKSLEE